MARHKYCPKCDADVSDSYQASDPDTGIIGGYYCDDCDMPVEDDEDETHYLDDLDLGR